MQQQTYRAVILLGLGLAVRAALIQAYPQIFGSDSITRLVNRHLIVLAHQLPALQASIWLLTKLSGDPLLIRYWMAGIGAVAGLAFYLLATDLMERDDAFCAALFFVSNPLLLAYSIVPYQEIVMLAGLFFAFHFFFAERYMAASVWLSLACLTRYEAWAAAPVLALVYGMRQGGLRPLGLLLFGWAPLVWVLYNRGLGPSGTFVADVGLTPARLMRYVYLGWITLKNTPIPVLWLAGLGLWKVRSRRLALLGVFLGLFLLGILFSAHGDPRDRERFVSAREAHLTIAAVLLLTGVGLGRLPQWRVPLAAAGVALGLFGANRFVAQASAEPEVDLSYRAARYLDRVVAEGERVLVMAKPVPREGFEAHLRRAFRQGGETARHDAQRALERIDSSPPAYQRMLVHSRLGRERLRASGAGEQWIVVWSDLEPVPVMTQPPVETLRSGNLAVRIYRMW